MYHFHDVYDADPHFRIDVNSRVITDNSKEKTTLVQHDHNSERFTFEIPRYIEGHDMALCNRVKIHYINISADNRSKRSQWLYDVDDLQVSELDENTVVFTWLISSEATVYAGTLNFIISFNCVQSGEITYTWNTAIHSGIIVNTSIDNSTIVIEQYIDILEEWRYQLFYGKANKQNITGDGGTLTLNIEDGLIYYIRGYDTVSIVPPDTTDYSAHLFVDFNEPDGYNTVGFILPDKMETFGADPKTASLGGKWEVSLDSVGGAIFYWKRKFE